MPPAASQSSWPLFFLGLKETGPCLPVLACCDLFSSDPRDLCSVKCAVGYLVQR